MYNFKQKLVGLTSAASLVVGMFNMPGTSVISYAEEAQKPIVSSKSAGWTFGMYMCGQNLEEEMGCSTSDLMEILKADVPAGFSKDNNFIVETGGCWGWNYKEMYGSYLKEEKGLTDEEIDQIIPNEIDYAKLSIYKINFEHEYKAKDGTTKTIPALEFVKDVGEYDTSIREEYYSFYGDEDEYENLEDIKKAKKKIKDKLKKEGTNPEGENTEDEKEYANMGDSKYLKMFLDELDENYPAEHMAVDLWNHGGGITDGVCFDEYTEDGITLKELKDVLKARSEEGKDKLDILGYDACLMSNYETWINIAPYVETGVGALTSEPADGWYYTPFVEKLGANYKSEKYTSAELAKDIVKGYEDYYKKGGVLAGLMESGEYEKHRDKLGHFKELEDEFYDDSEEYGEYDAKLSAVNLEELALTSIKFGALSADLLDAFQDSEGIKEIFDQTVEKGAIEYFYEYEFSGIDSLFDAITDIAPGRAETLSESDNRFDLHAAECYKDAVNLAKELKKDVNKAVIADYKGWEESDFYNAGAMSIYTPFVYPSVDGWSDTAYFNYGEYPDYSISPDYARLMYLLAGNIKAFTIDDVDMTPHYSYDATGNKIKLEYDMEATWFLDYMCAYKVADINNKKYIIGSKYSDPFFDENSVEEELDGKYYTLTGEPVDAQVSEYVVYDKDDNPTDEVVRDISMEGQLNGKDGVFFFTDYEKQGLRFESFIDLSGLLMHPGVTEEEKAKIVKRATSKLREELEEDGEVDENDNLFTGFEIEYIYDLKVGDKIELNSATINGGTSFEDIVSYYNLSNYDGNTSINVKLGNEYTVKESDIYDGLSFNPETEEEISVKRYSPQLVTKEADIKNVDLGIGSFRTTDSDPETWETLAIAVDSKDFNIGKFKAFSDAKISVVAKDYELTGREIKPEIKFEGTDVQFEEGKDYEVVYENNLGLGKATVTVKGLGGYDLIADKTIDFNIVEAKQIVTNNGEIKTVYVVVKAPKQVKVKKIKNTKKKSFTVKWKKIKGAKGYEVKYALNKKFTKGKVVKSVSDKKASLKVSKLKKKKTYFVKVRAYTLDANGKKVYGDWSKTKKVKIKR